jgi:pyruvate/2-oxoglutarate dehydrogenase complex dihydrolipoamide acyltransferase (E2) component
MTIKMPKVGDSVDEVTIIEWAKAVGDTVTVGETLVPSPIGGTVSELLVDVDADVKTGTAIAVVEGD